MFQRTTVYLWLRRWDDDGHIREFKKTGRPRKTSRQQDQTIINAFRNNGFSRTDVIAINNNLSLNTVRRRLHEAGIHHRVPAKKLMLTARHKLQRLKFAQRFLNYDFTNVIFSDEKTFHSTENGRMSLWRMNNTRYAERNIIDNRASGRISVGFWGWMCSGGPGELIEIGGRLNSAGYIDILNDVLLPTTQVMLPEERPIKFVHDNCPIHKARVCRVWFNENTEQIMEIPFPPKSPDLNPIENLWALMVQAWDPDTLRTRQNIIAHATETWERFRGQNICKNMVGNMRERLQAVIDANGGHTRY